MWSMYRWSSIGGGVTWTLKNMILNRIIIRMFNFVALCILYSIHYTTHDFISSSKALFLLTSSSYINYFRLCFSPLFAPVIAFVLFGFSLFPSESAEWLDKNLHNLENEPLNHSISSDPITVQELCVPPSDLSKIPFSILICFDLTSEFINLALVRFCISQSVV